MLMSGYRAAAGKLIWKWLPTDFKRLIIKLMTKTIIAWDFEMHLGKHLDHKHPELSKEWHHVNFLLSSFCSSFLSLLFPLIFEPQNVSLKFWAAQPVMESSFMCGSQSIPVHALFFFLPCNLPSDYHKNN